MAIKIEKRVLESFIEKLIENRTEDPYYKTFEEDPEDETPIEASAHMSTQLSVEAPPVDDPDYMPGTKEELGRAANLIASEVPDDQIEKYYRSLHKLLDNAIDSHEDQKFSDELLEAKLRKIIREADGDDDDDDDIEGYLRLARDLKGGQTVGDIVKSITSSPEEQQDFKQAVDKTADMLKKGSKKDPFGGVVPVNVSVPPMIDKRLYQYQLAMDSLKSGEIPERVKSTMSEEDLSFLEGLISEISEQELTSQLISNAIESGEEKPEVKQYTDTYHLAAAGILEVNFLALMALQGGRFGGMQVATPEQQEMFGSAVTRIPAGNPGSKEYDAGIAKDITTKYALDVKYGELLSIQSMLGMSDDEILSKVAGIVNGMYLHNPIFTSSVKKHTENVEGLKSDLESLIMISQIISNLYAGEKNITQMSNISVGALINTPFAIARNKITYLEDLSPNYNPQLAMKKKINSDKVLSSVLRRPTVSDAEKERIKTEITDYVIEYIDSNYFYEDKNIYKVKDPFIKGRFITYSTPEEISEFQSSVDEALMVKFMNLEDPDIKEEDIVDEDKEEQYAQDLRDAENAELRKIMAEMEKRADPTTLTHIAPILGYSGANGLRQWMNKFPERKLNIIQQYYKSDETLEGLGSFVQYYKDAIENMSLQWYKALSLYQSVLEGKYGDEIKFELTGTEVPEQEKYELELVKDAANSLKYISDSIADYDDEEMTSLLRQYEQQDNDIDISYDAFSEDYDIDTALDREELDEYGIQKAMQYYNAMKTFGGVLVRKHINLVPDDIAKSVNNPWMDRVQRHLEDNYNIDSKLAKKFRENFTGTKNIPNFEEMKSTAREFTEAGIDASTFFKIYDESIDILDQILIEMLVKDKHSQSIRAKMEAEGKKVRKEPPTKYAEKMIIPIIRMDIEAIANKAYDPIPDNLPEKQKKKVIEERNDALKQLNDLFDQVRLAIIEWNELARGRDAILDAKAKLAAEKMKLDEIRLISDYIESLLL